MIFRPQHQYIMASRRKDTDLPGLAARAERAKSEGDPSGFLSGAAFYSDFAIILGGCIDFDPGVPDVEQKQIIQRVAHEQSNESRITADSLLRACSRLEQDYLSRAMKPYRLLTEISLWWTLDVPKVRINDIVLTFKPKLEKAFSERRKLAHESRSTIGGDLPTNYMRVSAYVHARSPIEAAERGLDALDLLRASWNLSLNRGKAWRYSSGQPSPVNDILLSPFHTVHESNGSLATETFWYDPGYKKAVAPFSDSERFGRLLIFATDLRRRLATLGYREDIQGALIRYVRALDSADLNDAFLRLWSLLEFLTNSTHDPYKVATRRAAFLFTDKERSQLVLSNLTNHRNRFVHVGSETEEIESLVFQLKRYVDALLLFHLGNRFGFTSREEAARFMDLPVGRSELKLRKKRLEQAERYIFGSPETPLPKTDK